MNLVREALYNHLWKLGVIIRNKAKQEGLLGQFDSILTQFAPRITPPPSFETKVTLPMGIQMMIPPNFLSYRSYAIGFYEPDVTSLILNILKEGMTFADVGANIGYYTLLASRKIGSSGRVYAFEPDRENYSYLVKNVAAVRGNNVMTVPMAVFNKTGSEAFVREGSGERSWLRKVAGAHNLTRVETVTLDDFFAGESWPSVDLVKMDIEGSEASALDGMKALSRRNPQMRLIIEFYDAVMRRANALPQTLQDLLLQLGFKTGYLIERNLKSFSLVEGLPKSKAVHNLLLTKR